jgi:hypothetical protein
MTLSSTAYNSICISTISSNLHHFNWIFIFGDRETLGWKFLFFLAWSCRSLHILSPFCFRYSCTQGTNSATICPMFKSSVKMHQHVQYNRPRMLKPSLIVSYLSSWMSSHTLSTFLSTQHYNKQPEHSIPSTEAWSLFTREYNPNCVLLKVSWQKASVSSL